MKGKIVTFEETRKIQLDLLAVFDAFCRHHGINYSLGEGTLIGAIRHQGFIPWDDDIDILMPRRDYECFIEQWIKNDNKDKYQLITLSRNSDWCSAYSRFTNKETIVYWNDGLCAGHGIWISLIPIEHFPKLNDAIKLLRKRSLIYKLIKLKQSTWNQVGLIRNIGKLCGRLLLFPFSFYFLGKKLDDVVGKYKNTPTSQHAILAFVWSNYALNNPLVFPSFVDESFEEYEFEGKMYKIISGYDLYLKLQYGDYMMLPPENKRIQKHDYKAYYLE